MADNKDFVISRVLDAPRELVWKVFSEPERMKEWRGPKGFTVIASKMDFRPGGIYHYGMQAPNGAAMWGKFVYREIVAPQKIVFVNSFSDSEGNTTRAPFSPNWPLEILNTVLFTEQDGKTTLAMTGTPINATDEERKMFESMRPSLDQGFKGTLDQLAEYLAQQ